MSAPSGSFISGTSHGGMLPAHVMQGAPITTSDRGLTVQRRRSGPPRRPGRLPNPCYVKEDTCPTSHGRRPARPRWLRPCC